MRIFNTLLERRQVLSVAVVVDHRIHKQIVAPPSVSVGLRGKQFITEQKLAADVEPLFTPFSDDLEGYFLHLYQVLNGTAEHPDGRVEGLARMRRHVIDQSALFAVSRGMKIRLRLQSDPKRLLLAQFVPDISPPTVRELGRAAIEAVRRAPEQLLRRFLIF